MPVGEVKSKSMSETASNSAIPMEEYFTGKTCKNYCYGEEKTLTRNSSHNSNNK